MQSIEVTNSLNKPYSIWYLPGLQRAEKLHRRQYLFIVHTTENRNPARWRMFTVAASLLIWPRHTWVVM